LDPNSVGRVTIGRGSYRERSCKGVDLGYAETKIP
jgi:hypothetical protein